MDNMKIEKDVKLIVERILILIDGSNFYHSIKKIIKEDEVINYNNLISMLVENSNLVGVFYYVAKLYKNVDSVRYDKHEKFLNNLSKIPKLTLKLCNLKKIKIDGKDKYFIKGDDIRLAQDLLIGAFDDLYDTAIIVSGDEDFVPIIKILRDRFKKKVGNAYFRSSSSYKLRKACNFSIKLNKYISRFVNKKKKGETKAPVLSETTLSD